MKILRTLVIAPQPYIDIRGTPMANLRLIRHLADAGYEVHVATYPFGSAPDHPGVTVHRCGSLPLIKGVGIGFSPAKLLLDLRLAGCCFRLAREMRFDCFHGVEEGALIAAALRRRTGARAIYDMDSVMSHDIATSKFGRLPLVVRLVRAAERFAVRNCDLVMTISENMGDHIREIDPKKDVAVVHDVPLSSPEGGPDPERARLPDHLRGRKIILYAGSFASYQGLDLLIDAMPEVVSRFPESALVVLGGSEREIQPLKRAVEASGMMKNLAFLGKTPPEEVPHFLSAADVLVSPRRGGENPPAKIYTYMQSGTPIVATNIPAHTSALNSETCTLSPPTPQGIAEGILWALAHPEEAAQKAHGAREAVKEMTPESEFRQIRLAYERLMNSLEDA